MKDSMDRRQFLTLASSALAVGALVVLQGCGGGSSSDPTPTPTFADKDGAISANHGHSVTLTAQQQEAGLGVALSLTGGGHVHTVDLSAADVSAVIAGNAWSQVASTTLGHSHTVTFN